MLFDFNLSLAKVKKGQSFFGFYRIFPFYFFRSRNNFLDHPIGSVSGKS